MQAGSFQVSENADDLVKELSKIGFAPTVSHDTAGGKDRYRVLAAAGIAEDQAKATLARLSAAGFTGLIVAEK